MSKFKFSIIIPAYNPGYKIHECLNSIKKSINFFKNKNKIIYEIIIINDGGNKINIGLDNKLKKKIKLINLKKNRGVGFARQYGTKISKYSFLFFIDSDLIIRSNTLYILYKHFNKLKNVGSIGPIQDYKNFNKDFSSNFVCAKSCYGFEQIRDYVKFSAIRSECCLINKNFLNFVGGWKFFPNAGGEEFELGNRIIKYGKINYLTKRTSYSTYWDNIFNRSRNIILRTSNYLPVFLSKKKFESKGAFATFNQASSAFITLMIIISCILFIKTSFLKIIFVNLFLLNLLIELKFLIFVQKYFEKKTFFFSFLGIFVINFSIIIGFILGIFQLLNSSKFHK